MSGCFFIFVLCIVSEKNYKSMKFTTPVAVAKSPHLMNYQTRFLSLGSCFAENIGKKLNDLYFDIQINPSGIVFNPVSVADCLYRLLEDKVFTEQELLCNRDLWFSYAHSTLFSGINKDEVLNGINHAYEQGRVQLLNADRIIITLGTAWVYQESESGRIVSNCHKLPANQFVRRRLQVSEIVEIYKKLLPEIKAVNPAVRFIFTVSPVRHIRDGFHENNISKSILHLFVEEITYLFEYVDYFPAWEIMMDELRDYRFYAEDMLHPSGQAIDYIFEKFCIEYFDKATSDIMDEINAYNHNLNHRFIHPDSMDSELFRENLQKQKNNILANYPFLTDRIQ
jgi:hypothetical protein